MDLSALQQGQAPQQGMGQQLAQMGQGQPMQGQGMPMQGQPQQQIDPRIAQILQQVQVQKMKSAMVNQPGYKYGIPEAVFNVLEPEEQKALASAGLDKQFDIKTQLDKNAHFKKSVENSDLPHAKRIIDQYLQIHKITGLDTPVKDAF